MALAMRFDLRSRSLVNHFRVSRSTSGMTAYARAARASASGTMNRRESLIPDVAAANALPWDGHVQEAMADTLRQARVSPSAGAAPRRGLLETGGGCSQSERDE